MISTLILYSKTHALCTPDLVNGVLIRHRLRCFAISWGFIGQLSEGLLRWSKLSPVPAASPGIGKIHISLISVPNLHLDDILFSQIIDNQIGTSHTACTCLNIIVSDAIDQRTNIQHKQFSSILFYKCIRTITEAFYKMLHKFLQDFLYIQTTLCDKLSLQLLPGIVSLTIDCVLRNEKVIKPDFKNSI